LQLTKSSATKIGLGTVQFGMAYGVTNSRGRMPEQEAADTLALAARHGIRVLDTAQAYGDGEAVLGGILPDKHDFRIVTKVAKFEMPDNLRGNFLKSLARLRQGSIYALLCHDAEQLLKPEAAAVWQAMKALRAEGYVEKIGASVYSQEQITGLLAAFDVDVIQLPFNLLDQRLLASGELRRLKRRGVEIHARSTFLQGVLLSDPEDLDERFAEFRGHLNELRNILRAHDLSPLSGALACSIQRPEIDTVLVGVTGVAEMREILAAVARLPADRIDFSSCALTDPRLLNPSHWNSMA
jgi:aryl-alcohol dehydrogenase-like predicted oxidoreductase